LSDALSFQGRMSGGRRGDRLFSQSKEKSCLARIGRREP
jgi:hypothetical protein